MASYNLTIDHTKVSSTLTDFPVYVNLNDVKAGISSAEAASVRVYESDGVTEVPREIVSNSEMHFKGDLSSTVDTVFIIDIDGLRSDYAVSATYGRNSVWTNYEAVYHLEEDPSGISPQMTDSTGNGNDGPSNGSMTSADIVDGKLAGNSLHFDGVDDWIDTGVYPDGDNVRTLSYFVNYGAITGQFENVGAHDLNDHRFYLGLQSGSQFIVGIGTGSITFAHNFSADEWHYEAMTGVAGEANAYVDGAHKGSFSYSFSGASTLPIGIGSRRAGVSTTYTEGIYDEVRMAKTALSGDFIATEYANQSSPSTFYEISPLTPAQPGTYKLTIDHTKIDGDLSDFPVYFKPSSTSMGSITQAEADSIRIYSDSGLTVEVPREVVSPDEIHFKASLISSTVDTDFWIDYDGLRSDYTATHTYGRNNVWTEYEGVWHLEESPSGSSPQFNDSTGNGYDMEKLGSPTSVPTQIGNGLSMSQDNVAKTPSSVSSYSGTNGEVEYISAIIKGISPNSNSTILGFGNFHAFQAYGGGLAILSEGDNSGVGITETKVDDGAQHFVTGVFNQGNEYRIYKNGSQVVQKNTTDTEGESGPIYIGRMPNDTGRDFKGDIDEVRWSKNDLGSDWVSAEYANQSSPSAFYTVEVEEEGEGANGISVWTGSAYEVKPVKAWDGSGWVTKPIKYWNGSEWKSPTAT